MPEKFRGFRETHASIRKVTDSDRMLNVAVKRYIKIVTVNLTLFIYLVSYLIFLCYR